MAAHDNLELNPSAKRYSQAGTGGYVRAENLTELTRNQNIEINGLIYDMGKMTSSSGGGFIQIVNTAQDKLTEYSNGKTRTIESYSTWLADNTSGFVTTGDGLTVGQFVNYNPKASLTYSWGKGTRKEKTIL